MITKQDRHGAAVRDQARPPQARQTREPQAGQDVPRAAWYVKAAQVAVRALFRFFLRVRVRGLGNLPPAPYIICANHLGWADPFLILCFFPVEPRIYALGYSLEYVADEGARKFRSTVVNALGMMIQLRKDRPLEAVRTMRNTLKQGGSLLIFPEGTYMGGEEGTIQQFEEGAAHLSILTGTPIVPVGITGTKELWFRRSVTLRIARPVLPGDFKGDVHQSMAAMTLRLEAEVQALLPGDHERARIKLLHGWLSGLFYGEETFQHKGKRRQNAGASGGAG